MKANRIVMGLLIGVIIVGAVLLRQFNPLIVDMMFLIIVTVAGFEMAQAIGNRYPKPLLPFVAFYPVCCLGAFIGGTYLELTVPFLNGLMMVLLLDVIYLIAVAIVCAASKRFSKENFYSTMFAVIYPMTLAAFLFGLNRFGLVGGAFDFVPGTEVWYGATPIALMFAISSLSDTFALAFGLLFKGPKLAPKISPKKTISGAIGGLIGGVAGAAAILGVASCNWMGVLNLPFVEGAGSFVLHAFLLGIFGSVFTQAGDLVASVVKRNVGIKDYGKLLGSHGGMMDRVDGQLFNAFFVFFYLTMMKII